MLKMKSYEITCEECKNKIEVYRSINVSKQKFCSDPCRIKRWRGNRKRWKDYTDAEKESHKKKYYYKNVVIKDGCWDWKKKCSTEKYPRMNYSRLEPKMTIHTYSWTINFGQIPKGSMVCHKCDNTRCSNPLHLFLGTAGDNIRDCVSKGRHNFGSKHGMSKLTEIKVFEMKNLLSMGASLSYLSKKYSISISTIGRIKNNKLWKHVKI